MKPRFLNSEQIDRQKWDECVKNATHPLFYGLSIVYDTLCPASWGAIVWGDYDAVMPLSIGYKWKVIPYIYQANFIQQSGVYAKVAPTTAQIMLGLKTIPKRFVRIHTHLNYGNYDALQGQSMFRMRKSYQLDLRQGMEVLRKNYTKDLVKNLRKFPCPTLRFNENIATIIKTYQEAYGSLNAGITAAHYAAFVLLMSRLQETHEVEVLCLGVYDGEELMACGVFVTAFGIAHYCLGAPTESGRKRGATHTLLDQALAYLAEKQVRFFDFEGSEIPSVAQFYEKFAPYPQRFPTLKYRL
jgi:hypothetical protein